MDKEPTTVAVVGLGYVGLPTALALAERGDRVIGVEASAERIEAIRSRRVDLLPQDHVRLASALAAGTRAFSMTLDPGVLAAVDAVLICVPTPVDGDTQPDLGPLRAACAAVVARARAGQLLVLTSTTYVGATRRLLAEPLTARGLAPGSDIGVVFSPERIDPGNARHAQETVPRVVGGVTEACAQRAVELLDGIAAHAHIVSSPEAAELCKLYENTYRAVNIALANELADMAGDLGVDPIEVTGAAATKPYGYMPFLPGAGVGGHCIPCDPHYLLHSLPAGTLRAPLVGQAMLAIRERPARVAERALELLAEEALPVEDASVLLVGAAYKPGVADTREAPAAVIAEQLEAAGARVGFYDPLVERLNGTPRIEDPHTGDFDLAVVVTAHPGQDLEFLDRIPRVLDATFRVGRGEVV